MSSKLLRYGWIVPLLIVFIAGLAVANRTVLSANNVYADRDFMTFWGGGKAVLEGRDPYDSAVWLGIKVEYGATWLDNAKDPYPFWTAIAFAPLAVFSVTDAAAVWLALSQVMLFVSVALLARYYVPSRLSLVEIMLLVGGAFLTRWTLLTLLIGQLAIFLVFVLTLFLVLIKLERPFWAGAVLTLLALKPHPFLLLLPLVALWLIVHRRWRVVAGGAVGGIVLLALSWIILPGWIADWLYVRGKLVVTQDTPTLWGLGAELGGTDWWALVGLVFVILATGAVGAFVFTRRDLPFADVVGLGIVASLLVTPYMWAYEQMLLLIPVVLIYARVRRMHQSRTLALGVYLALCVLLPWLLYIVANHRALDTYSAFVALVVGACYVALITRAPQHV